MKKISVVVLGVIALASAVSLRADAILTYTGGNGLSITFETNLASVDSTTITAASLVTFSMTDSMLPPPNDEEVPAATALNNGTYGPTPSVFSVTTDALGDVTSWSVTDSFTVAYTSASFTCIYGISSTNIGGDQITLSQDNDSGYCPGETSNPLPGFGWNFVPIPGDDTTPGTWSDQSLSTSPEPGSYALVATGIAGLIAVIRRRKQSER